jgi:putative transferase (TIGR04331 family)
LILEDFNQKVEFIKLLNAFKLPEFSFKIRPYPDRGWSFKDRYIDMFGTKILSKQKTLQDDFLDSKLNICTYPETTFFESMQSGIPTVLLYVEKYWELEENFIPLARHLVRAKIAHTDSLSAATHIKDICTDPQKWWNKDETKEARLMFDQVCGVPSKDVSIDKEFHGFLVNISNKKKGSCNA